MKKLVKFAMSFLVPRIIKNMYLMARYSCIIHPSADIKFINNIIIGKGAILGRVYITAQGPIRIGSKSFINDNVILNSKTGYIHIGSETSINHNSVVFGNGGVEIGNRCAIGLNVQIVKNHRIPERLIDSYDEITPGKTIVGDSVWLCSNVVIVDGVTVGSYSVVGSNSLVSRDIPEAVIAGGIPAKVLKGRE